VRSEVTEGDHAGARPITCVLVTDCGVDLGAHLASGFRGHRLDWHLSAPRPSRGYVHLIPLMWCPPSRIQDSGQSALVAAPRQHRDNKARPRPGKALPAHGSHFVFLLLRQFASATPIHLQLLSSIHSTRHTCRSGDMEGSPLWFNLLPHPRNEIQAPTRRKRSNAGGPSRDIGHKAAPRSPVAANPAPVRPPSSQGASLVVPTGRTTETCAPSRDTFAPTDSWVNPRWAESWDNVFTVARRCGQHITSLPRRIASYCLVLHASRSKFGLVRWWSPPPHGLGSFESSTAAAAEPQGPPDEYALPTLPVPHTYGYFGRDAWFRK